MRKLMAIFAHPDDEMAIGGTLAKYAAENSEVMLVCGTRGEVGEISDAALATPENLGEVRQKELEAACDVLGIQHLEFLGHRDSGMDGTPENKDPRALVQADPKLVVGQIVSLVRRFRPDIVITFEPFGWYGHPDHMAISRWTTEAMDVVGDDSVYQDMLPAWQPERFYYAVIPFTKFEQMVQAAIDAGIIEENSLNVNLPRDRGPEAEAKVTHILDIGPYFDQKGDAMAMHKTQISEAHMFRKIPRDVMVATMGNEYFIQVYPEPQAEWTTNYLNDLFSANGSGL